MSFPAKGLTRLAKPFLTVELRPEDYWRGIILFGRNVATYKFALGQALLELQPQSGQLVTLEELAKPFSVHLCTHLKLAEKQGTSSGSRFLDACRKANTGELNQSQLVEQTIRSGFNNVIDAFHIIGRDTVPLRFFTDERKTGKGIRISQAFADLLGGGHTANLPVETDARWRLVETAWELGVSLALLAVSHDPATESLFVVDAERRRKSITGARDALSGYQKGVCFYCFDKFSLAGTEPPDVDHFLPHTLKKLGRGVIIDGVWNLVLACRRCNRGVAGKFDRVPSIQLLERLHTRNEFLIASHHPLRDTLMAQTGHTEEARRSFLSGSHMDARTALIHEWEPAAVAEPVF
jgi:HNH endonuclease